MGVVNLLIVCGIIGIVNLVFLWYFTKIRYLERPQESEIEVTPTKEVIELETKEI